MEDEEDDSKHTYILLSTTVHDGCTSKSGHWFNHCLDVSTGNWYEINDRRIKNSNWNEVQETAGGKTSIRNLLYARKDYFKRLAALIGEDASNDGTQQGANRALLSNITVGTGGDDEFGSGNDGNDDDEDGDSEDGDSDDDKWTEMDNMMHEKLQQMKQHPSKVSLFFCTTQHRRCPWLLPCFFPTPHLTLLPHFRHQATHLSFTNELLIWRDQKWVPYPPVGLQPLLIEEAHIQHLHVGGKNVFRLLKERYFWPNMRADCVAFVSKCFECQLSAGRSHGG